MNSNYYITMKERCGFISISIFILTCHSLSSWSHNKTQSLIKVLSSLESQHVPDSIGLQKAINEKKIASVDTSEYPPHTIEPFSLNANISHYQSNSSINRLKRERRNDRVTTRKNPIPFDPNHVSFDQLMKYDIPDFAIKNLIKYREAGGSFYKDSDMMKIYGIDSVTFKKVQPFIRIDNIANNQNKNEKRMININIATVDQLISLRGIGPVLSERIVKYRNRLGGFYHVDQLKEVYGISEETFLSILPEIESKGEVNRHVSPI